MKKYAVAFCSVYDGTNIIEIVDAEDEITALILALEKEIVETECNTVEELQQYYFDGDIIVSKPVLLK